MRIAVRAVLLATTVATLIFAGGGAAVAAPFACAGITEVPGGAIVASDRNGNAILVTSTGAVIRCDGMGAFDGLSAGGFGFGTVAGVQTMPGSTFVSSFVGPSPTARWTLMQAKDFPGTNQFLVGYLGANADRTVVFWRSFAGGPIETWMSEGPILTP